MENDRRRNTKRVGEDMSAGLWNKDVTDAEASDIASIIWVFWNAKKLTGDQAMNLLGNKLEVRCLKRWNEYIEMIKKREERLTTPLNNLERLANEFIVDVELDKEKEK